MPTDKNLIAIILAILAVVPYAISTSVSRVKLQTVAFLFCLIAITLSTHAQVKRDSTIIQVESYIPDSVPGNNIVSRHLNWVQGTVLKFILDDPYETIKNDTNYMVKPHEKLRLGTSLNLAGANMTLSGKMNETYTFQMPLNAQAKSSIGLSVCYRGLSIGFSFSPFHLGGKNSDTELGLSMYNNRWGMDVIYYSATTYKGTFSMKPNKNADSTAVDFSLDIPSGSIQQNIYAINGYYVFNWRKFAFPAVFDHSWLQRRSAGSWMLGMTLMHLNIKKLVDTDPNQLRFKLWYAALGGGYGYNWVCRHHWLIHADIFAEIVPYVIGNSVIGEVTKRFPNKWPPVMLVGRFGVAHYFNRYFIAFNTLFNEITIGQNTDLQLRTNKWDLSFVFGVRF